MSRENLVHRLIAFFKRPDALDHRSREPVRNAYDDYAPRETPPARPLHEPAQHAVEAAPRLPEEHRVDEPLVRGVGRSPGYASRLDALVMRPLSSSTRAWDSWCTDRNGRMRYCTGRTMRGATSPTPTSSRTAAPWLAWDSGESRLSSCRRATAQPRPCCAGAVGRQRIIGMLYLDSPARNHLHRGIFDVFCDQAARLLRDGAA